MSTATVNGITAATCSLHIPATGIPFADVELADAVEIPPRALLIVGAITMTCTASRQGTYLGRTQARLVAGSARWGSTVRPRGYGSPAGVQLAQVIADAASEVGELVGPISPVNLGPFFARREGRASQVLDRVPLGMAWWVALNGAVNVGVRATTPSLAPFQLIDWDPGTGRAVVASEENATLIPGYSIAHPDLGGSRVISVASWSITGSELRGELWTNPA
jgi:hypothetical protein